MARIIIALVLSVLTFVASATVAAQEQAKLVSVQRIWNGAPHNAFTDLIRFKDRWFCVFREGKGHVSPGGALRVLTSADGTQWESAALVTSPLGDLRDAKLSITPEGQLMLLGAVALADQSEHTHQSLTWFSNDGKTWSEPHAVGDPDFWLWRATWHDDQAYGFGYATNSKHRSVRLYQTDHGKEFHAIVDTAFQAGYPNESDLVFLPDDTCYCLLRRDAAEKTAQLGVSKPPYTAWKWHDLGVRIGGPALLRLPDGRLIACVRRYEGGARTSLHWLDAEKQSLTEFLKLPSGGDTSYAGMVWHEEMLWVSYYSSHEGKTSIYLAKVELPAK
jgi:hypothetical protein